MEGIQVSVERTGINNNIAVIKVGGYIDTTTSAELEHSLDSLLKAGMNRIIIDLGNVDYISSAGWGIFISEIKGIRERGGDLKLVRMIPDVYEVFELLEFHYILKAFDTLDEAVRDFDKSEFHGDEPAAPRVQTTAQDFPSNSSEQVATEPQVSTSNSQAAKPQTLESKIKDIILKNPGAGTVKIKKLLNSPHYGGVRLGYFELRRRLKKLNLDSKQKRITFLRQQATN